ncbi:hypothetical protein NCCP2495_16070 [Dietzia sp. NCCP-2495]|uniref:hypothetical protein n=1 Tax=Dietzia sp. NCCP-2495 TaxID=2934675 RepID=UPI00222FA64C|nr:hypothetical protein [Dietzia sp. NCCP-2495]GLB63728.1 hypothetical protein NCCP2495_16070 [Dietzia sp. NCCP-2495]
MSDKFELESEEYYQAALAFIPVTEDQRTARTTARDDSASYSGQWGGDEMGDSFSKNYTKLRTEALTNANEFITSFDGYRKGFVDARRAFVTRDGANGDLQARIGEEITPDGADEPMTVEAGEEISFDGNKSYETLDEVAEEMNAIEDAQEEARDDAEEDYS